MIKRKQTIPKSLRNRVWNERISDYDVEGKCKVCLGRVTKDNFECSHIISEANGGTVDVNNLTVLCSTCNKSVGSRNLDEFMITYGLNNIKLQNEEIVNEKELSTSKQNKSYQINDKPISKYNLHIKNYMSCAREIAEDEGLKGTELSSRAMSICAQYWSEYEKDNINSEIIDHEQKKQNLQNMVNKTKEREKRRKEKEEQDEKDRIDKVIQDRILKEKMLKNELEKEIRINIENEMKEKEKIEMEIKEKIRLQKLEQEIREKIEKEEKDRLEKDRLEKIKIEKQKDNELCTCLASKISSHKKKNCTFNKLKL